MILDRLSGRRHRQINRTSPGEGVFLYRGVSDVSDPLKLRGGETGSVFKRPVDLSSILRYSHRVPAAQSRVDPLAYSLESSHQLAISKTKSHEVPVDRNIWVAAKGFWFAYVVLGPPTRSFQVWELVAVTVSVYQTVLLWAPY